MTVSPLRPLGLLAVGLVLVAACSAPGGGASAGPSDVASTEPSPAESAATSPGAAANCPTEEPDPLPAGETREVTISTSLGDIVIDVEADLSPIAAGNFVALADCGYYDGVVFHRVVPGFVIQGGDGEFGRVPVTPGLAGTGGPGYTITDEPVTTPYGRGTVAMARTSQPNSVGSQFFIVLDDEARTPLEAANTYQIIGNVKSGMEVVDAIAAAADAENPSQPIPMADVSVAAP